MGVIAWLRKRTFVWSWRARYWWMDTRDGRVANIATCVLLALGSIVALVHSVVSALLSPIPPDAPASAIAPWVVQIIIAVVLAVVSYALTPKPEAPAPEQEKAPTVEDGLAVPEVYGTCWIDQEYILAWKGMGRDKIKSKGGKK